mmetsp:Transcript_10876/g.23172  ORF Transcript_10876/g.23172 Transcript_10876/m.23172 type:complete len:303 (+) Transcript_10876:59-967(+)
MLQHPGPPYRKRPLQRRQGRQGNHRQPPQLDRSRPRALARSTGGRRVFLRRRKRQRRRNGRRGRLLFLPGVYAGTPRVCQEPPLYRWGILRGPLRPRHCPSHLEGKPEVVRQVRAPKLCRIGHRKRFDGARATIPVVPRNGLGQLARHQGRRRGRLQCHEGSRWTLHQAHPPMQPGRQHHRFLCLPGGLCDLQPRSDVALPGHGPQSLRHSQKVRGPSPVLRLFQRQKLAQPRIDQEGPGCRRDPQPPVGGLQLWNQRQVPHRLDEGLFWVRQRSAGGRLSGIDLRRRRGLYLQLSGQPSMD